MKRWFNHHSGKGVGFIGSASMHWCLVWSLATLAKESGHSKRMKICDQTDNIHFIAWRQSLGRCHCNPWFCWGSLWRFDIVVLLGFDADNKVYSTRLGASDNIDYLKFVACLFLGPVTDAFGGCSLFTSNILQRIDKICFCNACHRHLSLETCCQQTVATFYNNYNQIQMCIRS